MTWLIAIGCVLIGVVAGIAIVSIMAVNTLAGDEDDYEGY